MSRRPRQALVYKRVLVPLDGSMVAEAIVPVAVGLRASDVRVTTEVRRGDAVAEILAGTREVDEALIVEGGEP